MTLGYVLVAILGAGVAVFALQNGEPTRIRFLVWSVDAVPVAGVILISLAIGIVLTGVPLWIDRWRLRARVRILERRLVELERERAQPRGAPPGQRAAS